ncbi:hypothetical protein IHE44_0000504 [Lamprotornis superbus]|uniref:G-protein coupled receptors family 1 profile domain-containing protein n=1 Tax=Lamprotornis superbus TaxID=245042 RepID=A0A835TXS3_9PASS|nr:hypothetical protein IHE44_0000504 [Lamprotornis superbus]
MPRFLYFKLQNMYQEDFRNMTEGTRNSSDSSSAFVHTSTMSAILVTVYSVAFAGGGIGSITMSFVLLKMSTLSVTTTAIINLVIVHSLLLFTVPFRLHYYVKKKWVFDMPFCKMVSAMVHIHMYLTFVFYVITLVIRWLIFFQWKDKVEFYRKLHAIAASAAVWVFVMVFGVPLFYFEYGRSGLYNSTTCFKFHKELQHKSVKALNYTLIVDSYPGKSGEKIFHLPLFTPRILGPDCVALFNVSGIEPLIQQRTRATTTLDTICQSLSLTAVFLIVSQESYKVEE